MEYAQGLQYAKAQKMKNNTKGTLPNSAEVGSTETPDFYRCLKSSIHLVTWCNTTTINQDES